MGWQDEFQLLRDDHNEIKAKLDLLIALVNEEDNPDFVDYKFGWPTEPGLWLYVKDSRDGGFKDLIMRTELLGNEIILRYGGASYHADPLQEWWMFAGPITQDPKEGA